MQESRTADGNARGTEEPLPTEESGGPHTPSLLDNQCLSVWPAFPQNNKPAWLCSVGSWVGLCSCFSRLPRTGQGLLGELSGLSVRRATDPSNDMLSMPKLTHHRFLKLPLLASFPILVNGLTHAGLWPLSLSKTSPDIQ